MWYSSAKMSSEADDFTLEEFQEIKSQIEQYGMDLKYFKPAELSTTEVCKDIGHFNTEAWLSEDTQAGHFFKKLGASKGLCYMAGCYSGGRYTARRLPIEACITC